MVQVSIASVIQAVENVAGNIKIAFDDAMIIGKSVPQISAGVKAGKSLPVILAELEPEALDVVETIANFVFPGAGSAIGVLAYVISKSHPMTPEEERTWFEREDGTIRDSADNKADGW